MITENTGTAPVNGANAAQDTANMAQNAQNAPQQAQDNQAQPEAQNGQRSAPQHENSVPYARFQQVNEARKVAEDALAAVVDEVVSALPEDMRELVPNLPPAEKIRWINAAREKGFFAKPGAAPTVDSPGSQRPGGKPVQDLSGMTPVQMMSAGYSR